MGSPYFIKLMKEIRFSLYACFPYEHIRIVSQIQTEEDRKRSILIQRDNIMTSNVMEVWREEKSASASKAF